MGKQIVKKTVGVLLAVLFVLSLTASSVSATTWSNACPICGCNHVCDSDCGCGCGFEEETCSICGCNHVCGPDCGCGCRGIGNSCNKCCDDGPTWQEWFAAFQNDGFDSWSGFNGFNGLFGSDW
jgi:hypothetical protein